MSYRYRKKVQQEAKPTNAAVSDSKVARARIILACLRSMLRRTLLSADLWMVRRGLITLPLPSRFSFDRLHLGPHRKYAAEKGNDAECHPLFEHVVHALLGSIRSLVEQVSTNVYKCATMCRCGMSQHKPEILYGELLHRIYGDRS